MTSLPRSLNGDMGWAGSFHLAGHRTSIQYACTNCKPELDIQGKSFSAGKWLG